MHIAVVILNWNGRHMLEQFLPSVTAHTTGDAEVIIADNGSTDDSIEFLRSSYPALRIIQLDQNYGFADGYNRALAQVDADIYVLLNDDIEVTPHWLDPIAEYMEHNPSVAICQPKLLMYHQRDTFEYAGGAGGYIDRYGYPFCRGRLFNDLEQDHGQYDDPRPVFWATGAAMCVRADVWRQLGGLDGDFFAHMEEIDFCWRAQNQGYQVSYCPQSAIYHVGGGTLPKSNPHKTYLNFRNNLSMLYKNLPAHRLLWVISLRVVLDYVSAFMFLFQGKPKEFSAVARAHWAFYGQLSSLNAKRAQLPHPKQLQCIYPGLILLPYYLGGKNKYSDLKWN